MNKLDQIRAILKEEKPTDEIVMQLTDVAYCLRANEFARDDDLSDTWDDFKRSCVKLQRLIDDYIIKGET